MRYNNENKKLEKYEAPSCVCYSYQASDNLLSHPDVTPKEDGSGFNWGSKDYGFDPGE